MDFITDLPNSNGFDSIQLVTDHDLTKAIVPIATIKNSDVATAAKNYLDHVYKHYGLPVKIISNRDPRFVSSFWKELLSALKIRSAMSTAYHPQTDGQAERTNQEIELYLRIYCANYPDTWSDHLPIIQFAHNNRLHSVTKNTPF